MTAKRKIHKFDFSKSHHHVALVDKAANLTTVMVMKSDEEITVSLPMRDFLTKFWGMWEQDAAQLAGILGFSDGKLKIASAIGDKGIAHDYGGVYDNFPKYVNVDGSNPMMYKSANEFLTGEFASLDVLKGEELPDTLPYSVTQKILAVEKAYDHLSKTSKDSSKEDNLTIATGESILDLTKEEISKQAEDNAAMLKELETMKAAKAAETAEMETLKSAVTAMLKDKEDAAKATMVDVVKGYAFITDEAQEGVVTDLIGMKDNVNILKALEGARKAIEAAGNIDDETGTAGAEAGATVTDVQKGLDFTASLLKSRKKGANA